MPLLVANINVMSDWVSPTDWELVSTFISTENSHKQNPRCNRFNEKSEKKK
jgi:hypothetical protein